GLCVDQADDALLAALENGIRLVELRDLASCFFSFLRLATRLGLRRLLRCGRVQERLHGLPARRNDLVVGEYDGLLQQGAARTSDHVVPDLDGTARCG